MTENETMLINLIREHKNPEQALVTAVEVIISALKFLESSESKTSVVSQE